MITHLPSSGNLRHLTSNKSTGDQRIRQCSPHCLLRAFSLWSQRLWRRPVIPDQILEQCGLSLWGNGGPVFSTHLLNRRHPSITPKRRLRCDVLSRVTLQTLRHRHLCARPHPKGGSLSRQHDSNGLCNYRIIEQIDQCECYANWHLFGFHNLFLAFKPPLPPESARRHCACIQKGSKAPPSAETRPAGSSP